MIMTKEKLKGYESPTMDVLELRVEGLVCNSGAWDTAIILGTTWGDDSNDYGLE